jgi:hypothetical protein
MKRLPSAIKVVLDPRACMLEFITHASLLSVILVPDCLFYNPIQIGIDEFSSFGKFKLSIDPTAGESDIAHFLLRFGQIWIRIAVLRGHFVDIKLFARKYCLA